MKVLKAEWFIYWTNDSIVDAVNKNKQQNPDPINQTLGGGDPVPRRDRIPWWILGLVLLCITAWTATLSAQDQGHSLEDLLKRGRSANPEQIQDLGKVRPPASSAVQLDIQWNLRRGANNEEALKENFEAYHTGALQLGLRNRPEQAAVLLLEAQDLAKEGKNDLAQRRLKQARLLAPDMPMVDFATAGFLWETSPASVLKISDALMQGHQRTWSQLSSRMPLLTNLVVILFGAMSLFVLVLSLLVSARHLDLLAADLGRFLPSGITRPQLVILGALLIITPGILLGSPLLSVLVALCLTGAYMNWHERIGALMLTGAVALLPMAVQMGSAGIGFADSEASQLAHWGTAGCLEECQEALAQPASKDMDPALLRARHFLSATSKLRRGPREGYPSVIKSMEKILAQPDLIRPERYAATLNLGVAQAMTEDHDAARDSFERAAQLRPKHWQPLLNISRVLEIQKDPAGSGAAIQKAIAIGGNEAADASQRPEKETAIYFATANLPIEPLFLAHMEKATQKDAPTISSWKRIGGALPLEATPSLAGGAAALLIVTFLAGKVAGAATRCPSCGQSMHRHHEGPNGEVHGVCRSCHRCFKDNSTTMDYNTRVKHEARVDAWESRKKWQLRVGNALVPGLGSALGGSGFGVWLFLTAATGISLLWIHQWPLRDPWHLTTLWFDGMRALGVILLGLAFLGSLLMIGLTPSEEEEQ